MLPSKILATTLLIIGVASCRSLDDIWAQMGRMAGFVIQKCMMSEPDSNNLGRCLKRRTLLALDRTARRDVIEIADGVMLVKSKNTTEESLRKYRTLQLFNNNEYPNWTAEIIKRVRQLFKTHVLKVSLTRLQTAVEQARGKHKNNMMAQLLMFGMVAAGLIVIPMGFQFLAVLGGKALLLAKLALLLTSIQGLKKIATSQYGYGLYSTGQGPCKDALGYLSGCRVAGIGLKSDDYGLRVDLEDESWVDWLEGHYDRHWSFEPEGHASNTYTVQHERPDLLHPQESLHPRQDVTNNF